MEGVKVESRHVLIVQRDGGGDSEIFGGVQRREV